MLSKLFFILFWNNLNFSDSASQIMECMMFFHNYIMMIMITITILIAYFFMSFTTNKWINLNTLENHSLELIWTVLPIFILFFIAFPSLRILYLMEENFKPDITLKILGHQWYWSYEYSNFNKSYDSFILPEEMSQNYNFRLLETDNRIILPLKINLRLLISSTDVIHAWTIPSLGVKMDAIPGRLNQINSSINKSGLFFGQCSEICGANHSFMPIQLEGVNLKNFFYWIKK